MMELFGSTLLGFLSQLPVVLVWLIGLILSLVYWRRHPQVSRLTLIVIVGFLIIVLTNTFLNEWLPRTFQKQYWSVSQIRIAMTIIHLINSVISAILWGVLLTVIFGWRNKLNKQDYNKVE